MVNPKRFVRAIIFASLLSILSAASASVAYGQGFTLTPTALHPPTVDPGGSSIATIDLGATGGFDNPVSLSCVVTSNQQVTTSLPVCTVSPDVETPPANGPSLTITTTGGTVSPTLAGTYQITITGTASGAATQTVILYLNVADLTEDYTLTVTPTTAIPSPIPAGSTAQTLVTVMPIGSYTGNVTLSCLSVTPVVTAAPYCSFLPATVKVSNGLPPSSVLTITSFGPASAPAKLSRPRIFYALWLALPGLALLGTCAGGKQRRKLMGMLLLVAVAAGLLLMPACNSTIGTTAPNGEITPDNAYTFTLTATDQNGAGPSNLPPSTDAATVSVTVITANTAN